MHEQHKGSWADDDGDGVEEEEEEEGEGSGQKCLRDERRRRRSWLDELGCPVCMFVDSGRCRRSRRMWTPIK